MSRLKVDYNELGRTYNAHRREDPRLAARIHALLGAARTVLNVGAGTGAYEPSDRWVLAVEPSATMRAQRRADAAPVIDARAEALPFDDDAVDAAMACATIHHWEPALAGLGEMRRVARGPVVIFTLELACVPEWQREYLVEGIASQQALFPTMNEIVEALGGNARVESVPTPGDCQDGFFEAFWRRPRLCWTRRFVLRSRCGRRSPPRSNSAWSTASPTAWPPDVGMRNTVTSAIKTPTRGQSASSWLSRSSIGAPDGWPGGRSSVGTSCPIRSSDDGGS